MIRTNVLDYFTDTFQESFYWPEMSASKGDRKVVEYRLSFEKKLLGKLHLSTGRVVASDPLVFRDQPPFLMEVPPGEYEVSLSVAAISGGDRRVAFAMLRFGELSEISEWTLLEHAEWPARRGDSRTSYDVDSGTGCFMDAATQKILDEKLEDEQFDEFFCNEIAKPYETDRIDWINLYPDGGKDDNVMAFSTGWGDGSYSTYGGLDAEGRPVCFLTDFEVVRDSETNK